RQQLENNAKFAGRFDMHGKKDQKTYSLFFASNAPKGFEKMKEAMWAVDKASGSQFSDAFANHANLFETMGIDCLWDDLKAKFNGQTVWMSKVEQFVIEQTNYLPTHARQIFKEKEALNSISVIPADGYRRRKGTFKADK